MVALNSQGRSVKTAVLHAEVGLRRTRSKHCSKLLTRASQNRLYIYDIRVAQASSPTSSALNVSGQTQPPRLSIANAPNSINDVQSISSWQSLYQERRSWAIRLAEDCSRLDSEASSRHSEMDVMIRCVDVAISNLEISVRQIEPKYHELRKWVEPALAEHQNLASKWELYVNLARNTPISASMVNFMTRAEVDKEQVTLGDLLELETARKAGKLAHTARRRFAEKSAVLDDLASQMTKGLEGLVADFNKLQNRSVLRLNNESGQLLEDIEAIVNQIDVDYRTALGYTGSQRELAQVSKTASNHTERLVPSLKRRAKEMDEIVQQATQARNSIASEAISCMRAITEITSLHSNVRSQISILNQSEDDLTTFDYLRLIHQLPYVYASYVVEAIRRRDWADKVKTDTSTLANEMALFQDEESKRRRRWHKMVGSMYGPTSDTNVLGLEVNLLGEDMPWPLVGKDELDSFLHSLREQDADQTILDDIEKLIQELLSPTKQQAKRLKAFKNGSVHEAALGRSGLMLRGDDDVLRSLQDDKSKLESKVKTAESRVRRLEDLLHRQSQASRPGSLFPAQNQPTERRDSMSSVRSNQLGDRRHSSDGADPLLRRITQLENELKEEKQKSAQVQKDLSTRITEHDDVKNQVQEANSTKKDLLENMEALKREFDEERKSLENDIKTLKARIEDTEDEMEHFDQSRENEKASFDGKIQQLQAQIENFTLEKADEALKTKGQVDFLRKEAQLQREHLESSERQFRDAQDEKRSLQQKLQTSQAMIEFQLDALQKIHGELLPGNDVPQDTADLIESCINCVTDVSDKMQNLERNSAMAKTDLEHALMAVKDHKERLTETQSKLLREEELVLELRENLSEDRARLSTLEVELENSRDELSHLRARLSAGEHGSENLQRKLESEEKKVSRLTEELASRQSHIGSLEEELRYVKQKVDELQSHSSFAASQHEARDARTKDLTQRLYTQGDRLTRLLERCGYAVVRKAGGMTISKVPRAERRVSQSANDSSDPGNATRRSVVLGKWSTDSTDLDLLYWMSGNGSTESEAERYSAFVDNLGAFDMDTFCETVYIRIKEAEHKARRWQREARAYRDRAHALQKDAHEKIAFRQFKEGDLALFLPTRNQQAGAWAAFNVGCPHYFLREQDAHRLRQREWLVARISRVQERVVDLSKSMQPANDSESFNEEENDNPFQLSDGLRWYLIEAQEDKSGAPSTPGMGRSTVAANNIEATANIQSIKGKGKNRDSITSIEGINKTLSKGLESRRNSSGSKKAMPFPAGPGTSGLKSSALASETNSVQAAAPDSPAGASLMHGAAGSDQLATSYTEPADGEGKQNGGAAEAIAETADVDVPGPASNSPQVRAVDSLLSP